MIRAASIALATLIPAAPAAAAQDGPLVVLDHARVLAADGERWLEDHAVIVRGERIEGVLASAGVADALGDALASAKVIDLDGRALVPGLIDLHTHLLLHPYVETPWDEQVLNESLELRTIRAAVAARATLAAGFTTIRDLGTEGAGFADVALRDSIDAGTIAGPRVVTTTRAIVATGCYGPAGFDPRIEIPKGAQEVSGADAMRRAVREQVAAGADWIKLYADYGRRPGEAATPTFSMEELAAAVDEARSAGRLVAAHATTDDGIRRATLASAATIEHGDGASDETLRLMAERGVALCPTLAAVDALARMGGWDGEAPRPERLERALDCVRRAKAAGVTIACGSDAGVFAHGDNAREIALLVAAGLAPAEALRAATRTAAEVLRRADLGVIAPHATADLVAVDGDPLADPSALRAVVLVTSNGRIAIDDRLAATPRGGRAEHDEVLAFCRAFLDDFSRGDFDAVAAAFAPGAVLAIADVARDEVRSLSAAQFVERARAGRATSGPLLEVMTGVPIALVDHGIATVWTPFRVEVGADVRHGVDVFQLARLDGSWKIVSLSWTSR